MSLLSLFVLCICNFIDDRVLHLRTRFNKGIDTAHHIIRTGDLLDEPSQPSEGRKQPRYNFKQCRHSRRCYLTYWENSTWRSSKFVKTLVGGAIGRKRPGHQLSEAGISCYQDDNKKPNSSKLLFLRCFAHQAQKAETVTTGIYNLPSLGGYKDILYVKWVDC